MIISQYNKEAINHSLNHMLKLDDKLTGRLLTHLWHNEVCEKVIRFAPLKMSYLYRSAWYIRPVY